MQTLPVLNVVNTVAVGRLAPAVDQLPPKQISQSERSKNLSIKASSGLLSSRHCGGREVKNLSLARVTRPQVTLPLSLALAADLERKK
jgi:hypothetical protein